MRLYAVRIVGIGIKTISRYTHIALMIALLPSLLNVLIGAVGALATVRGITITVVWQKKNKIRGTSVPLFFCKWGVLHLYKAF